MHTAFQKEILRSITRSLSRFAAIFAIVALGAGFYAGLRMCAPDMRLTLDRYFDQTAFMDVHLVSTLGFSSADVTAVRQEDNVSVVMPSHQADATATIGGRRATVRVHSLPGEAAASTHASDQASTPPNDSQYLNRPLLVAGRWPQTSGECMLDSSKVFAHTAQLGDQVALTAGITDLADTFAHTHFTVVGVFDSSSYVSFSRGTTSLNDGSIDRVMYILQDDFAHPATYTDLYLTVRGAADVSTFQPAYRELVDPVTTALEKIAPEREVARLAELKAEAQGELDEKRSEYEKTRVDADMRLAQGQAELGEAAATLAALEEQLGKAQLDYAAGEARLTREQESFAAQTGEAEAQLDAARAELDARTAELQQLADALEALQAQIGALEPAVAQLQTAYDAALAAEALGQVVDPTSGALATQLGAAQEGLAYTRQAYSAQSALYAEGTAATERARAQLEAGRQELEAGEKQARAQFAATREQLAAAKQRIAQGRDELEVGKRQLDDAQAEYQEGKADAEAELAEAHAALEEAQAEIDDLAPPTWYVLGRDTNTGYADFTADADRIEAISIVFPLIFFLVAALVALTTMTRMVDEERTLIGTYKALGYGRGRIAAKYLIYAGAGGILGSVCGIGIGSQVLPQVIWRAYTTMYTAPALLTPVHLPIALGAAAAAVGVTLLATILAVETSLRESPATLMLPRAPRPGKRIFLERIRPFWSRLSFSQKVTARNLFRYKKRLLMTVIGITGCTALLLTGFALKDSIGDILDRQYGEVYLYDTTIGLDPDKLDDDTTLTALLNDQAAFTGYLPVRTEGVRLQNTTQHSRAIRAPAGGDATPAHGKVGAGDASLASYMCCPSDLNRIDDFIRLRTRIGSSPLSLSGSGVLLTEKAADMLSVKVGDSIYVERLDSAGDTTSDAVPRTVTGITEQYVAHFLYISPDLYRRVFDDRPAWNGVLGKAAVTEEAAQEALSEALLGEDAVTTVQFADDIVSSFDDMLNSLNSVVLVLILSAGMLAFIVLYNLTNLNVLERRREIATIKVLGFYESEVDAYIYRETAALTALGCVLGLLLGVGLARFVITTVEVDVVMFGRAIHPMSYAYSAALTLLFAVVVNLAMRPRLRKIDMVESLKSVE